MITFHCSEQEGAKVRGFHKHN